MSKIEKIIMRLKSKPKDFTYDEAIKVLNNFGFIEYNKGKTSGSRVLFINNQNTGNRQNIGKCQRSRSRQHDI